MKIPKKFFVGLVILCIGCLSRKRHVAQGPPKNDTLTIPRPLRALDSLQVYSLNNQSIDTIRFKQVATFTDSLGIGRMGHMAVDHKGRVFIAEGGILNKRQTIHIYTPGGHYLGDMGRAGAGPGEFKILSNIRIRGSHLYAYDYKLQRINIFSLKTLSSAGTLVLNPQSWKHIKALKGSSPDSKMHFVRNNGTILFGFTELSNPDKSNNRYRRYYIVNDKGNIISDQIFKEKDVNFFGGTGIPGPQSISAPTLVFERHALMAVSDDGHIYSAWSGDFLIKVYDPTGAYLHAFYYPYNRSRLEREEILNRYRQASQQFQQSVRNADFPSTWPALNSMLLDDKNRLWISTITNSNKNYQWWVLAKNGKPLGTFSWPGKRLYGDREEREIKLVKGGYLYAVKTDTATGLQKVVKYHFIM